MKKITDRQKIILIGMLAISIAVLSVGGISFAVYRNQAFKRGVVRNQEKTESRFGSNYMKLYNEGVIHFADKVLTFRETAENTKQNIEVTVTNYPIENDALVNENSITYTLELKISNGKSNSNYVINNQSFTTDSSGNAAYSIPGCTLSGRNRQRNTYTIEIYSEDLNKIKITVSAIPDSGSMQYTNQKILGITIYPCTISSTVAFNCTGAYKEDGLNSPADYEAYNYDISISKGQANVTLTWNTSYFYIDPFFLQKLENATDLIENKAGEGSLTFKMDVLSGKDEYIIPFYPKSDKLSEIHNLSWEQLKERAYISVTATENVHSTNNQ